MKEKQIKQLKELLTELKQLESVTDELDSKYENEPENEEIEKAFDEAYRQQYSTMNEICERLAELTGTDYKTARLMITTKRNDIERLLAKTI